MLVLVYPEARLVFLRGWRLELMLDPLVTGRVARVHAEKHLGTLILDEAWVSEISLFRRFTTRSDQLMPTPNRMNPANSKPLKPAAGVARPVTHRRSRLARRSARTRLRHTARAHLERAMAHIQEAYIAINESKPVRTVPQLVDDLNRIQQVMDDVQQRGKSQRI